MDVVYQFRGNSDNEWPVFESLPPKRRLMVDTLSDTRQTISPVEKDILTSFTLGESFIFTFIPIIVNSIQCHPRIFSFSAFVLVYFTNWKRSMLYTGVQTFEFR